MAFQLRKLLSDAYEFSSKTCLSSNFCVDNDYDGYCPVPCIAICPEVCHHPFSSPPPPPISASPQIFPKTHKFSLVVVYLLSILSFCFVLLLLFAYYRRFRSRRFSSPARSSPSEGDGEFVDEEEGPILDHPIWYIRTVGVQPSLISAITICKYKRGDGLIEGTDCSVCLTEFEEDEDLRLLPKCNHAFHLPCIDTWLRSHTNCPLCRAPVTAAALPPEPAPAPVISSLEEDLLPENSPNVADSSTGEDEDELAVIEGGGKRSGENSSAGEGGLQPMRRSVSLDSVSAFQISSALSSVLEAPKTGSNHLELAKASSNQKGKTKILLSLVSSASSSGKSVAGVSMKRSLSCTSKFFQRTLSSQRKNGVIPR